jgi:TPR repeat protein
MDSIHRFCLWVISLILITSCTTLGPPLEGRAREIHDAVKSDNLDKVNRSIDSGLKAYCEGESARSFEILRPHAEEGNVDSQVILGILLWNGALGVQQNRVEGLTWYRKAAEQGDGEAQVALGLINAQGDNVKVDYNEAVRLFSEAAGAGFKEGQYNLAYAYFSGLGIAKDDAKALELFKKAANQGSVWAQSNLGFMYGNGRGTPQNLVEAYKWSLIASKRGDKSAEKALIDYETLIPAEEISKAKVLAENFEPVLSPATQKVARRCRDTPLLRE